MRREEDGCKGCGLSPCYHCTEVVLECDECGNEEDTLYLVDGEELCRECAIEALLEDVETIKA